MGSVLYLLKCRCLWFNHHLLILSVAKGLPWGRRNGFGGSHITGGNCISGAGTITQVVCAG